MDTKRVGAIAVPQRLEAWRVLLPTIRLPELGVLLRSCVPVPHQVLVNHSLVGPCWCSVSILAVDTTKLKPIFFISWPSALSQPQMVTCACPMTECS